MPKFRDNATERLFPLADSFGRRSKIWRRDLTTVIDETAGALDQPIAAGESRLEVSVSPAAIRIVFALMVAGAALIAARAFQVQVVAGGRYLAMSEGNRSRIERLTPERGIIYDRGGAALVRNVPSFTAAITPENLPLEASARLLVLARLAEILAITPQEIEETLKTFGKYPTLPVSIGRELTHEQAILLRIEADKLPGLTLQTGSRREYLTASARSLSHVLGYEGRMTDADIAAAGPDYLPTDKIGRTGVERSYESVLRGRPGERRVEVDAGGRIKKVLAEEPGAAGKNIVLTIDLDLQRQAERSLQTTLKKFGKARGSVIVMKPSTGEILALVNEPDFDNNLFAKGISSEEYRKLAEDRNTPLFARAIAASLPSGSTFKPVIAGAALEEGTITPATSVLSTGGITYGAWFFPDWKAGGHGPTNVTKAIAESVNTFFYAIGGGYDRIVGLGPERIAEYASRFGFGSTLGIDLPGEGAGFLPSKEWKERVKNEPWYIGDTYHIAIGQGDILVTPLQVAAMTAVFANGGTLYKPHVVAATTSVDGDREPVAAAAIRTEVLGRNSIEVVRRGMRQTVTAGSGRGLADLPVAVAAKTGTAQWNSDKPNHAWFTSFAPYDQPEIVVTTMIEEGEEGSRTAAAVAKEIYAWYFGGRRK